MSIIPNQRHLFDIPDEVAYFDCAKMSPLLKKAGEAGVHGLMRKARPWELDASHWFDESERVRGLAARLFGAPADSMAIVPSVSYGLAVAARNVEVRQGRRIVTLAGDFPSIVHTCRALAEEKGAELVAVERPVEGSWTQALIEAVTPGTALVCSPHVHWMCGTLIDLAALSRRCREMGAALVLDTTQSTGALPLDMAAVDPDYRVAASYKWMMGPYSLGFLYVAPRRQEGVPIEQGWVVREGAEDFRRLTLYTSAFAAGARRFDMGERSNFALLPVAGAAIEQLLAWGLDSISETLGSKTRAIAARLAERGIIAPPEHRRAPHYLSVRFPHGIDDHIVARLAARNVHVSIRGESMRITPHLYNNDEDVERLLEALSA